MIRKYKNREIRPIGDGNDSGAISVTVDTIIRSVAVAGDVFESGDIITVRALLRKTTSYGGYTIKLWHNSTASLTGADLLGTFACDIDDSTPIIYRRLAIGDSEACRCFNVTTSASNDLGESSSAISTPDLSYSSNGYYIISVKSTVANRTNDTITCSYLTIEI